MALTAAEKQKRYRAKKSNGNTVTDGNGNAPVTEKESVTEEKLLEAVIGPPPVPMDALKLYSPERWARLQAKGYVMPPEAEQYDGQLTLADELPTGFHMGYARKVISQGPVYQWAVPAPGDPAYQELQSA
ncbi:hypothetical protein KAR91_08600 [Candidatus Pacearchaeota archaeon]|nr:hypothetical protein [Candidatus Pacearchaeota archaeon]